jgi:membrane fusion protein (multidrug efflux system)
VEEQQGNQVQNSSYGSRKKIGLAIAALILLAAIAGGLWYWHYLQITVSTDDAQVTGNIADISPKINGRLEKLDVSEGDVVTAGQELAELDHDTLQVAMNQAEAAQEIAQVNYAKLPDDVKSAQAAVDKAGQELQAAQAQVKVDEFTLSDAKRNLDQSQTLNAAGAASKEALDDANSKYGSAQAKLDADQANVLSAQASLQSAQANLESINDTSADYYQAQVKQAQAAYDNAKLTYDESYIYATTDGTVVRVPAVVGENLSPGTPILSISDLRATWVDANVLEGSYGRIHLGQNADVHVDAYPGKVFQGKVIELGGVAQYTFDLIPIQNDSGNFTKITQRIPIKIEVDSSQLQQYGILLKPGMSVEVTIHTA